MRRISLIAAFMLPCYLFAGGFQLNIQGIKAVAMGGAFIGLANDASTVFFNPAGMCNLTSHSFTAGVNIIDPSVSLQTPETANINQTSGIASPIQFYYAGQINEKLSVGFLVNNQFGSASSFEDDWQGRNIIQNISLRTFMFQPTVSYKLHEKLSVGAGLVYAIGSFSTEKAVPLASNSSDEGKASLEGSGGGLGYNIGIHSKLFEFGDETKSTEIGVGLNYKSIIGVGLNNGEATFTGIPSSLVDKFPATTGFTSDITLPSVLTFGVSAKYSKENWSLTFVYDLNYTGWSSYDTLAFDFENADTPDSKQIQDWDNVLTHRFGVDYTYKEMYSIRAGFYYDNTPMKDNLISPHLPGVSQIAYTAGLGIRFNEKLSIDLSYIRQNASRDDASIDSYKVEDGNFVIENGTQVQTGSFPFKFKRQANIFGFAINYVIGKSASTTEETTE